MIYFLVEADKVKIGYALDIETRRKALQTGVAKTLFIVGAYEGNVKDEKALHKVFEEDKLRGEWFSVTQKVHAHIIRNCVLGYGKERIRIEKEDVIKYKYEYINRWLYEPASTGDLYVVLLLNCYFFANFSPIFNPIISPLCQYIFPLILLYAWMIHKVIERLIRSKTPTQFPTEQPSEV